MLSVIYLAIRMFDTIKRRSKQLMRYLGNKDSITNEIITILKSKGLYESYEQLTFFDAFAGTGSVADSVKDKYNLIVNDSLEWSTVYTKGRILASSATFSGLGFDPFEYINSEKKIAKGFFYNSYSLGASDRMYFTKYNAGRIDYVRNLIDVWQKKDLLNYGEYEYLLASLVESISKIANTAGVYGAFLKKWDPRALKDFRFIPVPHSKIHSHKSSFLNKKIEDIIENVDTDILYLDPPYTQNQYGTQYHIFETLVKNDHPEKISKVTGSRPTGPMRSDWSKKNKVHILLDKVLSKTKAKYVLLSYSSDGIMSKTFIESIFKRYGIVNSFVKKKISYKKYQNFKSRNSKDHYEYLYFIQMKPKNEIVYESPLNYSGSKASIIDKIMSNLPENFTTFYDVFGGGFNVGINIEAEKIIYNDINFKVGDLISSFKKYDTYQSLMFIQRKIKKYDLQPGNSEAYKKIRSYYNGLPVDKKSSRLLYTIIMYGFQQQIRFNSKLEFNNPVGMRWFNDKLLEKFISFSRKIKEQDITFSAKSFTDLKISEGSQTMLYLDPPYRLTVGSYNDGKRGFEGWGNEQERELMEFMVTRNKLGNKIMLSYVLQDNNNDIQNDEFRLWLIQHPEFRIIHINGHTGWGGHKRDEVLVMNY